jgi:WD40 repeat protein
VFSPDGAFLAIRPLEAGVIHLQVVNLITGNDWTERIRGDTVESLAFRPDGKALAAGTDGGRVRVYDPRNGNVRHEFDFDAGGVGDMTFSPDGADLIAVSNKPGTKRLLRLDAATGKVRWECQTGFARDLTVTADGGAVIYRGVDREEKYSDHWHWLDATTGKPTGTVLDVGNASASPRAAVAAVSLEWPACPVGWRPDGRAFALGGQDGLIAQWDLTTRKRLPASADPSEPVRELHVTPDGTKVRGWARGWYEWDLKTGKQSRLMPGLELKPSDSFAISRDLRWLARPTGAEPAAVEIIDLATRHRKHLLKDVPEEVHPYFLKDGRLAIVFSDALHLYDPATGARLVRIAFPGENEPSFQIAADGRSVGRLARSRREVQITRWSLETGKVISKWEGEVAGFGDPMRERWSGAWLSPDGGVAAFQSLYLVAPNVTEEETVLLDSATGRKFGTWTGSGSDSLTFSPDGRSVLTYNHRPFSYYLYEVATGGYRAQVQFRRPVTSFTFGPAARTLVVAARPHPVEVWDAIGDAGPWEPKEADWLWDALASPDAQGAYVALRNLLKHPPEAAAFLKTHVKVPEPLAADWLAGRLKALDAPAFRDREKATAELAAAGELAVPPLRAALAAASAEAGARIQGVLSKAELQTPEKLRAVRVCEVADGLGTPEGRTLLEAWAKGDRGTTLVLEARASVERIKAIEK